MKGQERSRRTIQPGAMTSSSSAATTWHRPNLDEEEEDRSGCCCFCFCASNSCSSSGGGRGRTRGGIGRGRSSSSLLGHNSVNHNLSTPSSRLYNRNAAALSISLRCCWIYARKLTASSHGSKKLEVHGKAMRVTLFTVNSLSVCQIGYTALYY
jgi:hypothetical protein